MERERVVLGTHFNPRNGIWPYRENKIRFVGEPLLKEPQVCRGTG